VQNAILCTLRVLTANKVFEEIINVTIANEDKASVQIWEL
jgi:hypothetical protein